MDPYSAAVGRIGLLLADLNTVFASVPALHYDFFGGPQPPSQHFNPPSFRLFAYRSKPSCGRPTLRSKAWRDKIHNQQECNVQVPPHSSTQQPAPPLYSGKPLAHLSSSTKRSTTQLSPTKQTAYSIPKRWPNRRIYQKQYQPQQNNLSHDSSHPTVSEQYCSPLNPMPLATDESRSNCSDLEINVGPSDGSELWLPPICTPEHPAPEDQLNDDKLENSPNHEELIQYDSNQQYNLDTNDDTIYLNKHSNDHEDSNNSNDGYNESDWDVNIDPALRINENCHNIPDTFSHEQQANYSYPASDGISSDAQYPSSNHNYTFEPNDYDNFIDDPGNNFEDDYTNYDGGYDEGPDDIYQEEEFYEYIY